jgi:citrate synthase
MAQLSAPPGLEGVIVAETRLSDVRGAEGFYHYRQYDATQLAATKTLEDVWALFFDGDLPSDPSQQRSFRDKVKGLRRIPREFRSFLSELTGGETFEPLAALRTAISCIAAKRGFRSWLDAPISELYDNALLISAMTPALVATLYRLRSGMEPVDPNPTLSAAANYLYMLNGAEPDPKYARAVEQYLILTIDHGFNASTFAARVITSTGADLGSALVGAIGALSGPLHGGAPSRAVDMLLNIGRPDFAEQWIREAIHRGERIMGFGHRIYKGEDPRSRLLRGIAADLGGPLSELANEVEHVALKVLHEVKPGRQLYTNVEYYAGVVMHACGIPPELFTATFMSSRMIGWCAHILEQASYNRLIRPSARYVGPEPHKSVTA